MKTLLLTLLTLLFIIFSLSFSVKNNTSPSRDLKNSNNSKSVLKDLIKKAKTTPQKQNILKTSLIKKQTTTLSSKKNECNFTNLLKITKDKIFITNFDNSFSLQINNCNHLTLTDLNKQRTFEIKESESVSIPVSRLNKTINIDIEKITLNETKENIVILAAIYNIPVTISVTKLKSNLILIETPIGNLGAVALENEDVLSRFKRDSNLPDVENIPNDQILTIVDPEQPFYHYTDDEELVSFIKENQKLPKSIIDWALDTKSENGLAQGNGLYVASDMLSSQNYGKYLLKLTLKRENIKFLPFTELSRKTVQTKYAGTYDQDNLWIAIKSKDVLESAQVELIGKNEVDEEDFDSSGKKTVGILIALKELKAFLVKASQSIQKDPFQRMQQKNKLRLAFIKSQIDPQNAILPENPNTFLNLKNAGVIKTEIIKNVFKHVINIFSNSVITKMQKEREWIKSIILKNDGTLFKVVQIPQEFQKTFQASEIGIIYKENSIDQVFVEDKILKIVKWK